jgi:hypothetical protein
VKTTKWGRQAALLLKEEFPQRPNPSFRVLKDLAEGAYDYEPHKGPAGFLTDLKNLMAQIDENTILKERSSAYGRAPQSLVTILKEKLALQIDILTDALHKQGDPIAPLPGAEFGWTQHDI